MIAIRNILRWLAFLACLPACAAAQAAPVTACAFSPDGASVVVAHQDAVVVRSARDGAIRQTLSQAQLALPRVSAVAFSPDGTLLAIAGGVPGVSGRVVLWDWQKSLVATEIGGFQDLATSVAFSLDGRQLAVASADTSAQLYRVSDAGRRAEPAARLVGHAGPVLAVALGPDGKTVITASADRSLKVWESGTGLLLRTLGNHTDAVHGLALRPARTGEGAALPWACASTGDDRTVRVWQPEIGRMVRIVRRHDGPVFAVAYALGGAVLLSAGAEGIVRAIDADGDQVRFQWQAGDDWVYALAVSPDGKSVVTGDWAGRVKAWDLSARDAKRRW